MSNPSNGTKTLKYKTAAELAEKIAGFPEWCVDNGRRLLVEWLLVYLDISDETYAAYKAMRDENSDYAEIIKRAEALCRATLVDNATGGTWRDAVSIFCLKNNYGYTDSSKIELDSNITIQFRDDELAD